MEARRTNELGSSLARALTLLRSAGRYDQTIAIGPNQVRRLSSTYVAPIPYIRASLFEAMLAGEPVLVGGFPAPLREPLRGLPPAEAGVVLAGWLAQRRSRERHRVFVGPTGVERRMTIGEIARTWRENRTPFGVADLHIRGTSMEDVIDPAVLSGFNLLPQSTIGVKEREMFSLIISTRGRVTDSHSDDPDGSNYCFTGRKLWLAWDTYEGAAHGLQDMEHVPIVGKPRFDMATWLSLRSARWFIVSTGETLFMPGHLTHKVITLEPYIGVGSFYIALPNCLRLLAHWIIHGPLWSKRDTLGERDELLAEIAQSSRDAILRLRHAPLAEREQWGHDYLERSAEAFIKACRADHLRLLWSDHRFRCVTNEIRAPWPRTDRRSPPRRALRERAPLRAAG
jgi:hypothetical protein